MSETYVKAIQDSLSGILNLFIRLALPLSILMGLSVVGLVIVFFMRREATVDGMSVLREGAARAFGMAIVGVAFVICWAALKQTRGIAVEALRWRDASEAVANPTSDAPPISQSGPVVAEIRERTYTKTINLPPSIGEQLKLEGVQALRPYLPDSTSPGVLGQTDKLEQRGNLYTLTRQVTQNEEFPISFQKSSVGAKFKRLGGRAYELDFSASYEFKNPEPRPAPIRFSLPLPPAGTIDGLKVSVGADQIQQPAPSGNLEWSGTMAAGESRTAVVSFKVTGSKTWSYDIGSQRRRVEQFSLQVEPGGSVKFIRGSLQPTQPGSNPLWTLSNVVTNQRVELSFPTDAVARESYVQTLAMLPAGLAIFLFGMWLVSWRTGQFKEPILMALGVVLFAFGLGGTSILSSYFGPNLGVAISLAAGCAGVACVLGARSLAASVPAALFVAAFMSAENTGAIVAVVFLASVAALLWIGRTRAS